jgi:CBS domain-containing protein
MSTTDTTLECQPGSVGDLMTGEPIVIAADAPLVDAAQLMERHRISGLPVVGADGELVGVISQTDMLHARATEWLWANWTGLKVRHLMTHPALTIGRTASLSSAVATMEHHRVHRLVVVADADQIRPIGVISTSDVVRALARGIR